MRYDACISDLEKAKALLEGAEQDMDWFLKFREATSCRATGYITEQCREAHKVLAYDPLNCYSDNHDEIYGLDPVELDKCTATSPCANGLLMQQKAAIDELRKCVENLEQTCQAIANESECVDELTHEPCDTLVCVLGGQLYNDFTARWSWQDSIIKGCQGAYKKSWKDYGDPPNFPPASESSGLADLCGGTASSASLSSPEIAVEVRY